MRRRKYHGLRRLRKPVVRHSAAELTQIAKDIHMGQIFTSWHLQGRGRHDEVFIVLALADKRLIQSVAKRVGKRGIIYEYLDKASPMGCNGMPMFFSCKILCSSEATIVREKLNKIERAMSDV